MMTHKSQQSLRLYGVKAIYLSLMLGKKMMLKVNL